MSRRLPDYKECDELLRKYRISEETRAHCKNVYTGVKIAARRIAENYDIDLEVVYAGAMLHDIGKPNRLEPGYAHAVRSAHILEFENIPMPIVRIARLHHPITATWVAKLKRINPAGFNMPEVDYLPQTVEEKLVVCVDKHFKGGILLKTEEYLNARKKKDLEYYRDFLETYIRGLCKEIEALAGRKRSWVK